MRAIAVLLVLALVSAAARAEDRPAQLRDVAFDQRLGDPVPLDVPFRDEDGKTVTLRDYMGKPMLLVPASTRRLPGADALGTPAPATIKADRDYDIVDEAATARRRAEAAQAERPVYEHDTAATVDATARIDNPSPHQHGPQAIRNISGKLPAFCGFCR